MRRDDLAAFASWGRHDDPLFAHYDVRALEPREADEMWRALSADPARLRPYAALLAGRVAGTLVLRPQQDGIGDIGIVLDPAVLGRGYGRRILTEFAAVVARDGFTRLQLDVGAYNGRAIAAYRAAGFRVIDERWQEPELDVAAVLAGPHAAVLAPYVQRMRDGEYRVRVLRMERDPDPNPKETTCTDPSN